MTAQDNNFCLILAGGVGRRLWPCSREKQPKQFVDFFGVGRTQLQQTFDRFAKFIPTANIFISTSVEYEHFVHEQLPEIPVDHILTEPVHRDTAPSVAWASFHISRLCDNANIIVSPSDQIVINEAAFGESIRKGLEFVSCHEGVLSMGTKPTRPEPGYGYIQMGKESDMSGIFRVKSFTEKPERSFAQLFVDSGEFCWNTGVFLSGVNHLLGVLRQILPSVASKIDLENQNLTIEEEKAYMIENYPRYPNLSIDNGILEKSELVYVMCCDFGWADLGTWHSAYEVMSSSEGDNVVIDSEVMLEDCRHNVVKIPKDHVAVINGLDGYIVAEQGNVLLICKKEDSSALIRKYVNEVQLKYGEEYA